MKRTVTSYLDLTLSGPVKLVFSIAVAQGAPLETEELTFVLDGQNVEAEELVDRNGSRLHVVEVTGNQLTMNYRAVVDGQFAPAAVDQLELIEYLRPSRYCESDSLAPTAASQFSGLQDQALLAAVTEYVSDILTYVPGSSLPTDGAVRTFLGRQGVCRDYAHLCIALLRALNVPARLAAVFAPGLSPMEYHAVCEAFVDGAWYIVDATRLAPRQSLLRVSTGRDAADTAFLTNFGANTTLTGLEVTAVVDRFELDNTQLLTQLR
ncbi:MAG: transglutaminase family protein [Propionibacteriaceae bacterium]